MKLNLLFTLCVLFSFKIIFAQRQNTFSNKITYKLVYVPDSTNLGDKRYEYMYLFYKDGNSYYQSRSGYKIDSSKGNVFLDNPMSEIIIKNGMDSIESIAYIPSYHYRYMEPKKISWEILSDTLQIGKYVCQKAMTHLGGREWTVWFAPDIPISDGPFKFAGLPGLIIQAEDNQHFFLFTFEGLTHKISTIDSDIYKDAKSVTKEKFLSLRKAYRENPLPFVTQNKTFTSGKDIIMERIKARINKHNNLIERSFN